MWRTVFLIVVGLLATGFFSTANAEVVIQHTGATDPASEGWLGGSAANQPPIFVNAAVTNDRGTGIDAWAVGTNGVIGSNYFFIDTGAQQKNARLFGWTFNLNLRVADIQRRSDQQSLPASLYLLELAPSPIVVIIHGQCGLALSRMAILLFRLVRRGMHRRSIWMDSEVDTISINFITTQPAKQQAYLWTEPISAMACLQRTWAVPQWYLAP